MDDMASENEALEQRWVLFDGCVADPLQTITAILPCSKWSVLLLRNVMRDAMSEVLQLYQQLTPKCVCVWMT